MDNRFPLIVVVMLVVGCGFDKDPQPSGRPTPDVPAFSSGEAVFQDGGPVDAGMAPDSGEHVTPDAGSDAGTPDAGSDAGTQTPPPVCTQSQTRCDGPNAQLCLNNAWVTRFTCTNSQMCVDGMCVETDPGPTPVCTPSEKSCVGRIATYCDAQGQWQTDTVCPFTCTAGVCTGACTTGDTDCDGLTPRTCNASNQWVNGTACATSCVAGACDDPAPVCSPGQTDCQGDVPRSCNAQGQWDAGSVCPFLCSAGSCTGVCNPGDTDCQGDTPRSCNGSGQWVSGSECPFTCSAGSCQGECNPGAKQCDGLNAQTCNGSYQWATDEACAFQCSAGSCQGECNPGATDCQGDTPRSCNGSYQWVSGSACQYQCSAGACVGECNPGETRCNGDKIETCGGDFLWGVAADCPGANNADGYCDVGACTWDCNLDFDDCDGQANNGCEVNLNDDGMNCGSCGHDCCGGACGDGTCEVHSFESRPVNNIFHADDNNAIHWFEGRDLKQANRAGSVSTLVTTDINASGVTSDGSTVYYSTAENIGGVWYGGVYSIPVGGGMPATFRNPLLTYHLFFNDSADTLLTSYGGFGASDATSIRWYDPANSNTGGTTYSNPTVLRPIVINDDYIFTVDLTSNPHNIQRTPVRGGPTTAFNINGPVAGEYYHHRSLAIDDTNLYYLLDHPAYPSNSGIWKQPLAGGNPVQLVSGSSSIWNHMDSDGTYVYYTVTVGGGLHDLLKVPVAGGPPVLIAAGTTTNNSAGGIQRQIQVVDECVYWVGSDSLYTVATTP